MTPDTRLRPNAKEVAAKVMDGEAIMINIANGMYYSMDKVGGVIWGLIEGTPSVAEIIVEITAQYYVALETAQSDIDRLLAELLKENLIELSDGEAPQSQSPRGESAEKKEVYESPILNAYRDMAALLALDPPMPGVLDSPWVEAEA